ncbi:aegerolysin type hemolysin [Aspergillus coremiiformis]|uniref:Aegerolysin type hemolysin n=1 Tax=Aspergillus coremiiformis TaxID=138285 RepID=A0A5N6ZD54_9EURO|nr:aegerolysin type hemolysin [Aspergillus coremiiformis]
MDPGPKATSQWTEIRLENKSKSGTLVIDDIKLVWGKIYAEGNPNGDDVPISDVNGTEIKPGKHYIFRSCGRANSSSGTEGNFNLKSNGTVDKNVYWDSPWGVGANKLAVSSPQGQEPEWGYEITLFGGAGSSSGPLGNVTIEFRLYA